MKKYWKAVAFLVLASLLFTACGPTPEVIEKEVIKEVKVAETVLVAGTAEVIEKEVTTVVETVVTATPEPQAPGGGVFIGSNYISISSIDPHRAVEFSDAEVNPLMYEPLVAFGPDGQWKGVLAESWDVSEDGLTWTFHLRQGVKFHNGREMTADDVVFSFDRILNEDTGAAMRSNYANKLVSYEALDPYTVQFVLNSGGGIFLSELGLNVRTGIIAKECVTNDNTIVHPIGTGPFEFMWWKPGEELRASRFDDYWDQVASVDEVVFKTVVDDTIRQTALLTGEIDWGRRLSREQTVEYQQNLPPELQMSVMFDNRTVRLNFNSTRPPFDDVRVRQAVAYAIDKQALVDAVFFGLANPHNQPFAPDSFMHLPVEDSYAFDLEKAKALMVEAGYPDGLDVNIISHTSYKNHWEYLESVLGEIGLRLNVEILDSAQWTLRGKELDYDMMMASQSGIYHWDRTYNYFEPASSSSWLVGGYQNDRVSELLAKGRDEADLDKAKVIYTEIAQTIQDDCGAIFLAAEPDVQFWGTRVKGYEPNASNTNLVWPGGGLNYITLAE